MRSVRLVQFTDTHLVGTGLPFRGVDTLKSLHAAAAHATQRFAKPDGVLLTGDLVDEDPAGYQHIRDVFGASPVPVLCLPGNHDLPDAMNATLGRAPFQICGHASFGRWRVVMLDTWIAGSAAGRLGAARLAQLRETLATHRNDHTLLCLHHHPIRMRSRWLDTVGLEDSDEFLDIVRSN